MDELAYLNKYSSGISESLDLVVKQSNATPADVTKSIIHDTNEKVKTVLKYLMEVKEGGKTISYEVMDDIQKCISKLSSLKNFENSEVINSRNGELLMIEELLKMTTEQKQIFEKLSEKMPR